MLVLVSAPSLFRNNEFGVKLYRKVRTVSPHRKVRQGRSCGQTRPGCNICARCLRLFRTFGIPPHPRGTYRPILTAQLEQTFCTLAWKQRPVCQAPFAIATFRVQNVPRLFAWEFNTPNPLDFSHFSRAQGWISAAKSGSDYETQASIHRDFGIGEKGAHSAVFEYDSRHSSCCRFFHTASC